MCGLFVTVCVWVGGWFRGVADTGSLSLGWLYAREFIDSLVSQEVRVIGVLRFVDVSVCNFAVAETMNAHLDVCLVYSLVGDSSFLSTSPILSFIIGVVGQGEGVGPVWLFMVCLCGCCGVSGFVHFLILFGRFTGCVKPRP